MPNKQQNTTIPRADYFVYEDTLTGDTTLAVTTDLGRKAMSGSITNTHASNSFTVQLNGKTGADYTFTIGHSTSGYNTFSLEGMQISSIKLIHGSNSSYIVFVN